MDQLNQLIKNSGLDNLKKLFDLHEQTMQQYQQQEQ